MEKTNFTGTEIIYYALKFCYNWTEEDFKNAFKDSHLGWLSLEKTARKNTERRWRRWHESYSSNSRSYFEHGRTTSKYAFQLLG
jgi:hypothetical protein